MVLKMLDVYWVSRRLNNIASAHARAIWFINPCKEGACRIVATYARQNDCSIVG